MTTLLWTFPLLMFTSIVVGWAAEITALNLSVGLALAVLAWLQCAPEFAVEASIAWSQDQHLALANLTGSLRLLLGLGWPMIFFIYWFSSNKKIRFKDVSITLHRSFAVEALGLLIPLLYFLFIVLKGTWSGIDGIILCLFYGVYFWLLNKERKLGPHGDEIEGDSKDEPWLVQKAEHLSVNQRWVVAIILFILSGTGLVLLVHPFVEGLKQTANHFGVSDFIFIQWIAPIASEFPEKVTAFNWARKSGKVSMAIVNMLSSVTSQWTLLAGLVPIIFSLSAGHLYTIELTQFQKIELLLTVVQSGVAVILLADLKITLLEGFALFFLWFLQLLIPHGRVVFIYLYAAWFVFELVRLYSQKKLFIAWNHIKLVLRGRAV